ncbi:MAG: type II toxin-antitoxin system VapC family toxin [Chloroflexi bacterium]|nr:type II toxin-antitoxin system VapC family toxin [Chloroflexota bacterium]
MITLNGKKYKLLLVDTNILSEVIKNRFQEFRKLLEWTTAEKTIVCFSLFTVLEIRRAPTIYARFSELFSTIPCIILKSHEQLLHEEVSVYPVSANVNPILVGFPGVLAKAKLSEVLDKAFRDDQILADEKRWISGREEIVADIIELVKNFPPDHGKYTKKKIREFVQLAGFQQIALPPMGIY